MTPFSRSAALLATATLLVPFSSAQSSARPKIEVSKLGPQVGDVVPEFSLKDQNGKTWTRQSIMGRTGAMLVFVRSADWCPYCKTQLIELQSQAAELRKQGLGIATISYDPPEVLAGFAKQHGITYTMLSDVGSAVIKRFGLLNPVPEWALGPDRDDPEVQAAIQKYVSVVRPTPAMVGIAFPGNFILDPRGRVKQRFFEDFYIERNAVSSLLIKLGGETQASVAGTKISTAHLDMTTYPSTAAVAAGNRFSVTLDIKPRANIHVYAPGAKGYKAISLKIDPQANVKVLPLEFPVSEIYHFKPLDERVPVFQKPFRLLQELVLEGTLQAQGELRGKESITIRGTFDYQACNDRECFNPVSVPLSWTVGLRPIVTQSTNRAQ